MSQTYENSNKVTGIYRCFDDVKNLIIRVHLREIVNENYENYETIPVETKTFEWQEKKFGKSEKEFYKEANNCVTDLDKRYHDEIKKLSENDGYLYNYVNDDEFCFQEEDVCSSPFSSGLHKRMNALRFLKNEAGDSNADITGKVLEAASYPFIENNFEIMHIMADFGEYLDNTWIKSEYILCTIKYFENRKILSVYPDFTIFGPYKLIVNGDSTKTFEYTIENASQITNEEIFEKENDILNQISMHERKLKRLTVGSEFMVPPKNKLHVHVFLEICTAKNFEFNDIYVQYFIDLPEGWSCYKQSDLKGVTQTCYTKHENAAYFGSPFEILLDFDLGKLEQFGNLHAPYIYLEVVSKDTFDRFRSEGMAYVKLPISQPGHHNFTLNCLRILPRRLHLNLRRFFIGDYQNFDDITWFGVPREHEDAVLNKHGVQTIGTGEISFQMDIIHQSQEFIRDVCKSGTERREGLILEKLGSSALAKSVEKVLEAFKKARENMLEARRKAN